MTKKEINKTLFEGCKEGDFNKVRLAINFGAEVRAKDNNGWTPLHYASYYNHIEIAKLLIERGTDVNAKGNGGGRTPLHVASTYNSIKIVELLIERGADVEAKDNDGWTPLYYASSWNRIAMAELLIDAGADVNVKDDRGYTPLYVAQSYEMQDLLKKYMK